MEETYVPGLNRKKQQSAPVAEPTSVMPTQRTYIDNEDSEVPVVGFLYSLSRGGEPEWWPLHIGRNTIGKSEDMDIVLSEGSISSHHANINLKRLRRSGNALAASLVDVGSKTGIILNDEELDYDPHTIHNEDIITFGLNYKCVVILIDPTKYGLEESAEFQPIDTVGSKRGKNEMEEDPFYGLEAIDSEGSAPMQYDPNSTVSFNGGGIDLIGGAKKII